MNAGALLALQSQDGCDGFLCELDNLGLGVLGGLTAAAFIDNALFSHETVSHRRAPTRVIAPQLSAGRSGGMVGLGGTF